MEITLADEAATLALGARLARALDTGAVVYLQGELGAGKTTLVRGLLRALGYEGAVVSPTYTLVETYDFGPHTVLHVDLYRVRDAEEVDFLGLRDNIRPDTLCLIEWPERAPDALPPPDLTVTLRYADGGRVAGLDADAGAGARACKTICDMYR